MDLKSYPKLKHASNNTLVTIDKSKFSIGRSLNCDYTLSLNEVSKVHCIFELESAGDNMNCVLRYTSSNGTYVNNVLLKGKVSKPLKNGDTIAIGSPENSYKFLFYEKPAELTDAELLVITDALIEHLKDGQSNINDVPIKKFKENPESKEEKDTKVDGPGTKNYIIKQDDVDDELRCSVCSEFFIKSVTLNCSHSFCKFCIEQWRKNYNICPICRTIIISVAPTIVLDNFISKVLLSANDDQKEVRTKLIEERDELTQGSCNKNHNLPNQPTISNVAEIEFTSEDESSDINYNNYLSDDGYGYDNYEDEYDDYYAYM